MARVGNNSISVQQNKTTTLQDVVQVFVHNLGDQPITVSHSNIDWIVPASNAGVSTNPFQLHAQGHEFDADIQITFPGGIGTAVLAFSKIDKDC